MPSLPVLLLTLLSPGAAVADDGPQAAMPPVDAIFSGYDHADTPGCALGVIRNGEFIYRRGYGAANLEYNIPISAQSIFRIGSTSKQFTAMAIALLAESGRISLDDSLRSYFPEFPGWADQVTVRQLVQHTSGIRDYLTLAYLAGKGADEDYYTDAWVLDLLARQEETNFPPGSQYLYSNSGYFLLSHLVKRVTGMSLRDYSRQEIFAPLGMGSTHFHDDHTMIVPLLATGYAQNESGYYISMTTLDMVGDGGVFTSIDQLLPWDRNFYRNQLGRGDDSLIELMVTPATLSDGTVIDYAFGLSVEDYRGLRLISHGGSFVGYRAELIRFPEQHFSVAVLCNRADAEPTRLALKVADLFLADEMTARSEPESAGAEITLTPEQLALYSGDFWEAREGFAGETQVIDGKLWAVHSPTRRNELHAVGPNRFRMVGVPAEVYVEFRLDDGAVVEMRSTRNGKPQWVFTPFKRRQISSEEIEQYTGDYYSPELDIHYLLQLQDGMLTFSLDDEGPQELTAMFDETFENPDYGSFTFQRDAGGAVTGYLLQSGRVRNLAFLRQ